MTAKRSNKLPLVAISGVVAAAGTAALLARRWRNPVWSSAADPCGPDGLMLPEGERTTVSTDDGGELSVLVAGSGDSPTVVLAHCWMGRMQIWAAVARKLLATGHRVVLYDQRGHGDSTPGSAPFTVERLGDDLHEVITAFDLRDAVLVGHSMGGMTIQAFAARHPAVLAERVRGVVLVATSAHNGRLRVPPAVADRVFGERASARLAARDPSGIRRAVGREAHRSHVQATHDAIVATSAAARAGFLVAMTRMDLRPSLASIAIPTRIVVGTHDRLTPLARARVLTSAIPGAQLQELDGYGHMLPLEAPSEVAATIIRVVEESGGGVDAA